MNKLQLQEKGGRDKGFKEITVWAGEGNGPDVGEASAYIQIDQGLDEKWTTTVVTANCNDDVGRFLDFASVVDVAALIVVDHDPEQLLDASWELYRDKTGPWTVYKTIECEDCEGTGEIERMSYLQSANPADGPRHTTYECEDCHGHGTREIEVGEI